MHHKIQNLRRIEMALIHKNRRTLYKANDEAKAYIKTVQNKELIRYWQDMISKVERVLNCA